MITHFSAFLNELCEIIQIVDRDVRSFNTNRTASTFLFPAETDHEALAALISDEATWASCRRLTRHVATAAIVQMLVLFDEERELGSTKTSPTLLRKAMAKTQPVPTNLHELLGDAMLEGGMEPNDWW